MLEGDRTMGGWPDNTPSSTLADGASGLRDERHVAGVTVPIWEGLTARLVEVRQRMAFAARDVAPRTADSSLRIGMTRLLSNLGDPEFRAGGVAGAAYRKAGIVVQDGDVAVFRIRFDTDYALEVNDD